MRLSRLAACAALAFSSAPAVAAADFTSSLVTVTAGGVGTFSFSVGGWGGGGTVTGDFLGSDLDADGQLSSFAGEVTGFNMNYSGGTIVAGFGLGFADLFGLVYDLDGGPLGDGTLLAIEGIGAGGGGLSFRIGPGPVGLCGGPDVCGIIEGPAPAPIPEPQSWAMMIAGLGLAGAALRRRGAKPALA